MMRKLLSIICIATLLSCSLLLAGCGGEAGYSHVKASTENYIKSTLTEPGYGDEWEIIGLARAEADVDGSFYDTYYTSVEAAVDAAKGELNARKYTEYSRVILALTAIGRDPADVGGYNLLEKLADFEAVKLQGINGPIWALIALDSGNYEIPEVKAVKTQTTRDLLLEYIVSQEVQGGGFGLMEGAADCDLTAMAVQALAPYASGDEKISAVVDRALAFLETCEKTSSESLSQTIVALSAMDVDAERYVTELITYSCEEGGFCHELPGEGETAEADGIATEQGYYALVAYDRYINEQSRLYAMQ